MEKYQYSFDLPKSLPDEPVTKVGVAGSGNLEVIVRPKAGHTGIEVNTAVPGFKTSWDAVIERFVEDYPYAGLEIRINDAGATPPVVALRLRQAIETYQTGYQRKDSYIEATARSRIYSLVDKDSFSEFLLEENTPSPTLPQLSMQVGSDDGVVIGTASIDGKKLAIVSQEKDFIGGAVGEVHGAKIIGLIKYAIKQELSTILFLIDSGGVRLQEANVGEIEISEIIRAILEARSAGIKTIGVICGSNGAYGGMGIISGTLNYLIASQNARIGVSGAEVIQAVKGAEVFDSSNRPLVWRVYGGRTRYLQAAVQEYTGQRMTDVLNAIQKAMRNSDLQKLDLKSLLKEHEFLQKRIASAGDCQEEGEWLKKYHPDLYEQDIFNCSDEQFLDLMKENPNARP
ncbi:acetyl coenzyme A carboxylase, carboxyltransferase subunit beta [Legionella birminghamensis]|uniref:Malonate decarboxylase acyl carrier protein n=1 Tax=Legionella birminghamensis TaxID=28083 RepID=A0A378IBC6_9GAMM|nr:biotin-independent malonate decarboxylase subunit beta [Legionella birminghamensis]KTC75949.1 acetyl coenzyme A carboxylase, carboxyltransferase subunit beta [Legionella birminghamensis]STX32075.1 acetyl coenzyme A carboxylase, carboxyltransferase subunit beta [Legionella birminghamensis]